MALTRKDLGATVLTALAVLTFAATYRGWDVWLVGDSRRAAAVVITLLGAFTCGLGSPGNDTATWILAGLGIAAAAFAVFAIATASMTALTLLAADIVVLWAASLYRHSRHGRAPLAA
jgi:hypothetical protein